MRVCPEHGLVLPCALCERGAWPLRDLRAVADFAGVPIGGWEEGVVPELPAWRLSEAIRELGRAWVEIEVVKATVLRPVYTAKNAIVRRARTGPIDVGRLERAAILVAKGETRSDDQVVNAYIQAIIQDSVTW